MAINLSTTNHTLEVVTTGTGAVHVVASYIDDNAGTKTGGSQTTTISSAATTTVVSAPSGSIVRSVHNLNIQAVASNTVTVQKDVSGTDSKIIGPLTLSTGERTEFTEASGWKTFLANGSAKTDAGPTGAYGGAITIPYTFSSTTTDSDPGAGFLRLGSATQNTSTRISLDPIAADAIDWTGAIGTFNNSTSTIKGFIRLTNRNDLSKWLLFSISSLATPTGYINLTVVPVASSAASPLNNGDSILLHFDRNGDKGDTGATGPTGLTGATGPTGATGSAGSVVAIPTKFDTTHSPVALYHFDNDSLDYSGNGFDLSSGTSTYVRLEPSGSRMALANGASPARPSTDATLSITGDVTLQVIVKMVAFPATTNTAFISFTASGESLATNTLYQLGFNGSNQLRWLHEFGAGATDQQFLSTGTTEDPPGLFRYTYYAAVRSSNVVTFYLDGLPYGSSSGTLTAASGGTSAVLTINPALGSTFFCLGAKVVNSALSAANIKAEYNRTMGAAFGTIP